MEVNLPTNVRKALYIATAIGTPVVMYLSNTHVIGQDIVTLWLAEVAVVSTLAAFNTKTTR